MPWKVRNVEQQRQHMMQHWQQGEAIAELARQYEVSRQTIYKWIERWQSGDAQLQDHGRAPARHPNQCSPEIREAVLALRRLHMRWGPRKLVAFLRAHHSPQAWPAASTIANWLREEALAQPRPTRRRTPPRSQPLSHAAAPNQVWCADFKGWFRTGDGARIDPLTMSDAASRFLLRCVSVEKTDGPRVRAVMEAAFRQYGLPEAIRTDNGAPFASPAPAGLSRLALWWIRLGIRHERIDPGKPQQNGRHERFHLTLKQETASPPQSTARAQQRAFQHFQQEYNQLRPHEALGYRTPAECYVESSRDFPAREPEPEFPAGAVLRRVSDHGDLRWRGKHVFISEVFGHEAVGLLRVEDRYWEMYYGPVWFGWLDGYRGCFYPSHRPPKDLESREG